MAWVRRARATSTRSTAPATRSSGTDERAGHGNAKRMQATKRRPDDPDNAPTAMRIPSPHPAAAAHMPDERRLIGSAPRTRTRAAVCASRRSPSTSSEERSRWRPRRPKKGGPFGAANAHYRQNRRGIRGGRRHFTNDCLMQPVQGSQNEQPNAA
eukprot:364640-Chlamydomonas_euryale.AAC.27